MADPNEKTPLPSRQSKKFDFGLHPDIEAAVLREIRDMIGEEKDGRAYDPTDKLGE